MTLYYFDSSALVKLYVPESGSLWVDQIANAKNQVGAYSNLLAFASISIAETAAAIARRQRDGTLSPMQRDDLFNFFMSESKTRFYTLSVTDELIRQAAELTQVYPLRGYDAVHLAAARLLKKLLPAGSPTLTFISADTLLLQAAVAEGLAADNPNDHP